MFSFITMIISIIILIRVCKYDSFYYVSHDFYMSEKPIHKGGKNRSGKVERTKNEK